MIRFASLGSGSRGNATLVEAGDTLVMIDCGFSLAEAERRLARLGVEPAALTGILVTHEHGDHVAGVERLARRHGLPIWATAGTREAAGLGGLDDLRVFSPHEPFAIDGVEVRPFPVPHDAREPSQFVFSDGAATLGVLSDTGTITPHIRTQLSACDAMIVECNHDPGMLAEGPYPASLKTRVGGRLGHLANAQAADLLGTVDCRRLQHLVAAHISETNNTPGLARRALDAVLDCGPDWIQVADQEDGLSWRQVG